MVPFLWSAAWKTKDPSASRSFSRTLSHSTTNRLPERSRIQRLVKENQELPHTWLTLLRNSHLPLSEYLTVEFWEKLGSKLAMSGATYCVAVSIRWVISPMKMKPGEQIYKIYLILVLVWLLSTRPKFSIWELWVLLLIKTFVQVLRLGKHPMSTDSNVQLLITLLLTAIGLSAN